MKAVANTGPLIVLAKLNWVRGNCRPSRWLRSIRPLS